MHGGSFNGPLDDWTLNTASVTPGGDPWNVTDAPAPDRRMIQVGADGEAVSPTFCLSNMFPTWRFFLQSVGTSPASALNVWVQWTDAQGSTGKSR